LPKENEPKEKAPDDLPASRVPCASRKLRGSTRGHHWPSGERAASMRRPFGLFLQFLRCSAASTGKNKNQNPRIPVLGFSIPWCCTEHRSPLRKRPAGARQGRRASFAGPGMARRKTPAKDEERRVPRRGAIQGVLSFRLFSLDKQRKGTRSLPLDNKITSELTSCGTAHILNYKIHTETKVGNAHPTNKKRAPTGALSN
jgi:hypothetical protein